MPSPLFKSMATIASVVVCAGCGRKTSPDAEAMPADAQAGAVASAPPAVSSAPEPRVLTPTERVAQSVEFIDKLSGLVRDFDGDEIQLRYDLDWATRRTTAVRGQWKCFAIDPSAMWEARDACRKDNFWDTGPPPGYRPTSFHKWEQVQAPKPSVFLYGGSEKEPPTEEDKPELMKRLASDAGLLPDRFYCRVREVANVGATKRLGCDNAILLVAPMKGQSFRVGDIVGAPLRSAHRDPRGVLFRVVKARDKRLLGWTVDADGAAVD